MVSFLVGVHRAAEDEDAAVGVEGTRQRLSPGEAPLLDRVAARLGRLGEDACPHGLAVYDRQQVHQPCALTGTFADCSKRWRAFAFAAACAMRPPRPSGLVALLLKNAYACSAWPASSRSGPTHSSSSSSEYR